MAQTTPAISSISSPADLDLRAQVERLEQRFIALCDQARQVHRLASLGTAAAALAHEFNNLMTPVVGYARHALDTDDVALMKKSLDLLLKQTAIGTAMADRVLGLAMDEAQSFQSVAVGPCVAEAVGCLCRDLSKDGIDLAVDIPPDLAAWSEPKQLQQVLFNLLINARHAIGGHSGRITVRGRATEADRVTIEVSDTGCGIPAEHLASIFEPFFTTKRRPPKDRSDDRSKQSQGRPGTGLGLAICRDIILQQRGQLTVASEVGKGTTFTITLPSSR